MKTIIAVLILLCLCFGCKVEVAPEGADGAQDTGDLFTNSCGC